jgi:hypothetical protein
MTTGLYVFMKDLPEMTTIARALKILELPTSFDQTFDMAKHPGGFVEFKWNTIPTPLELWRLSLNTMTTEVAEDRGILQVIFLPEIEERPIIFNWPWKNWRGGCCSYSISAALAREYNARVYETETRRFLDTEQLRYEVRVLALKNESHIITNFDPNSKIDW